MYKTVVDKYLVNQYILLGSLLFVFGCIVYNINIAYFKAIISILLALNFAEILVCKFNCNHLEKVGKETMGIYIFHFFFTFKLFVIGEFLCDISNMGLSTSIVIQLAIVLPVSYMIVKCCKFIIAFLKATPITALVCFGDLKCLNKKCYGIF